MANTKLTHRHIEDFISEHGLPARFSALMEEHYAPLAEWLEKQRRPGETLLLGINGAQGSGKSTLADNLKLVLETEYDWRVAVMSIDDFYLTKAERNTLARDIHPLLATRGVPGTHDVQLLADCIERLKALEPNSTMDLPRFDKALDDRADPESWPEITGPIDLIVLEGWCVGSIPQPDDALMPAINSLEEQEDPSGDWRRYANRQLEGPYAELFAQIDALAFLQIPNFKAAYRWRLEQEEKLAASTCQNVAGIMSREQLARFMQHYERLTRANLAGLPAIANVILELDDNHDCVRSIYGLFGRPCIR